VGLGCGVVRGGDFALDPPEAAPSVCAEWPTTWTREVRTKQADVALVLSCQWEIIPRVLPGHTTFSQPGDPDYDEAIRSEYLTAIDALLRSGAKLVEWVRCPHLSQQVAPPSLDAGLRDSRDPARMDHLNSLIGQIAATRPETVRVVDLGSWVDQRVDDARMRPDGSHFDDKIDTGIGQAFGSRVLNVWSAWRLGR